MRLGHAIVRLGTCVLLLSGCGADEGEARAPAMPERGDGAEDGVSAPAAEESAAAIEPDAPCPTSFTNDVMPKLVATCGSAACHLESTRPAIEPSTPQIAYEDLLDFGFDDESWIDPHPDKSHATDPELVKVVDGWRACGAPFE